MRIVDVLWLVGDLVVIEVPSRAHEHDRDAIAGVLVVITAAVVLLGVSLSVEGVIEPEVVPARRVHAFHEIAKLRRKTARAEKLEVALAGAARGTAGNVISATAADHVDVELRDD